MASITIPEGATPADIVGEPDLLPGQNWLDRETLLEYAGLILEGGFPWDKMQAEEPIAVEIGTNGKVIIQGHHSETGGHRVTGSYRLPHRSSRCRIPSNFCVYLARGRVEKAQSMIKLSEKAPIYLELYEALAHFLGRQPLVVRAVIEEGVSPSALARGAAGWRGKTSQQGDWGNEWEFYFHGSGCELRHKQSGEPIGWNAPDPQAFSTMPFLHHLEWRLAHEPGLPLLRDFVQEHDLISVLSLIDELIADGVITADRHLSHDAPQARKTAA